MAWGAPPSPPPPSVDAATAVLLAVAVVLLTVLLLKLASRRPALAAPPLTQRAPAAPSAPAKAAAGADARGPLTILWGSQTGTAEAFASTLSREARRQGFKARSVDLEEYDPSELMEEAGPVVLLMATHGEGEPTDNAVDFYDHYNDPQRADDELGSLRYAVFSLGNTQYDQFGFMGKWAQEKLSALGGTALLEVGLGDDDVDLKADFDKWKASLWEALGSGGDSDAPPEPSFTSEVLAGAKPKPTIKWLSAAFPKFSLVEVDVAAARELTSDPRLEGSVKHVELATAGAAGGNGHGERGALRYEAADDLGVCCDNGMPLAARTAALLGLPLEQVFQLKAKLSATGVNPPLPTPASVEQALRYHADLRAPCPKEVLLLLGAHASAPAEAARLKALASKEGRAEYAAYVVRDGRGLTELLEAFPSARPPWADLLELAPKLAPRYYTISSSPLHDGGATVHLTVKVLREPMKGSAAADARLKVGVCSTQLGELAPGGAAVAFVRPSAFRLPKDPSTPIIMVGPGTGIAPFRAFLQQMDADGAANPKRKRTGETRLYFGCRSSKVDFLYEPELRGWLDRGVLSTLRTAFSREQKQKVYVQQRIVEDGPTLGPLIANNAHVYVCGGTAMGREVLGLLHTLLVKHGGKTEASAQAHIKRMQATGKLVTELWS